MDRKEEILKIVEHNIIKHKIPIRNAVPNNKQIQNSIKSYAPGAKDIIALVDNTIMNNGKKGILFTSEGVYAYGIDFCVAKDLLTPQPISYDQVMNMEIVKSCKIIFTYQDGSQSIAFFNNRSEFFMDSFMEIQKLLNKESIVKPTYDLIQQMQDGSTVYLNIHDTYMEDGHTYLFTTGSYQEKLIPLLYEKINDSYILISEDDRIRYLCGKFLAQTPSLEKMLSDEEESTNTDDTDTLQGFEVREPDDDSVITLYDDSGNEIRFEFLDLIEYQKKEYVVLTPLADVDEEIIIMENVSGDDSDHFISIDSEEILEAVFNIFKERFTHKFNLSDQEKNDVGLKESSIPAPYEGDEPYIFISYSHQDTETVVPIIHRMMKDGHRIWYDEGIDPGSEWDENIAEHLEKSKCFIAFISENYIKSSNCKDEVNYARDLELERLLIYLDDVKLKGGMAMRLNRIQALFYHKYQLKPIFYKRLYESGIIKRCGT